MNKDKPQFIIGGRQNGKTVLLIKQASKTGGIIVCPTCNMAEYVLRVSQKLGYSIPRPISYNELLRHPAQTSKRNLYFDEYGMILVRTLQRQLEEVYRNNAKSIIIDTGSIDSLNNILSELQVRDMSGRELQFKIEVLGRNDCHDQD